MNSSQIFFIMQTIKKNWIYLLFGFAVILFAVSRFTGKSHKHADELFLSFKTFQGSFGWGYDIYTNDSVYIHQEFIPAIEGRKGFTTEEDARKVAKLALVKLKHSKLPMITIAELDSCGIKR